ncbi:MAG: hypothetical protein CHH17_05550 [Candidatus Fluviicola riflensis]|nr:MAG: hypothetical protein CHH17_05550 [Candidatus Fluviicola riflensis]
MKTPNLLLTIILVCFTFFSGSAQTITVTNPNGGEVLYSCQNYTVTWNTTGSLSNYYTIDYSLDGGTIWASVTSNYLSTNGQFSWTVPPVQSNTCLIRIRDAQNGTILDQSNAFFTINIPVTLLAPNGGEVLQGGNVQTITWNGVGTSNSYNLYYSTNNGASWTTIVTNLATMTGTYNWTVPNIPSTACLIRVRDAVTACMVDESNAVFTITPDDPILLTPNGAENWYPGCQYNITWNTATLYSNVNLEYSINNGTSWTTIVTNSSNDGSHTWLVPFPVSSTCLVRISNTANTAVNDVSDATFNIPEPIQVTTPNGGETLYGCASYNITWSKPGSCIAQFRLHYSIDNGTNWISIANPTNLSGNSQTYAWTVPNGVSTSQALIRVSDFANAAVLDVSNANFTMAPSNDITVTAPNGGEMLNGLSTTTITWTNLPSASGLYNIQYFNGSSWVTVVNGITGNAYNWSVPNLPATTCLVRVIDAVNTCKLDQSNATFTIVAATPLLLSPNGGENIKAGCYTQITWDPTRFYTNVRIDYSADGGTTWNNLTTSYSNGGSYDWLVPHNYGSNYLIKIANITDLLTYDVSDAVFLVVNPIQVVTPNGGETLYGCSSYNITWTSGCQSQFRLHYSIDNGTTWISIANPNYTGGTQSYTWTVPNGVNSSQALIRVSDFANAAVLDVSNANFNIAPSNDITVTAPNGGEMINALTTTTITWTNLPSVSGLYNVQYFNGSSWVSLATNISGNSYNWSVPNLPATTCLVRVIDAVNTCKLDQSDATFTIVAATPLLLSPNGGENIKAGCYTQITWDPTRFYTNVRIDYSADGGTTWNNLTASYSNGGSYDWLVPHNYGSNYLIKIANITDLLTYDVSDAVFSVVNPIQVVTPNGGETLYGCAPYTISWTKGCQSQFRLHYSIDNGANWISIANPNNTGSTTQTYAWTVPNGINSSQALIRVSDFANAAVLDMSNANFTIAPSNDITVTAPNGGEILNALTSTTITWTNLPSASGLYNVQYFNGSSWVTLASNISGNSYNWTVPNVPATTCLVRVIDAVNTCKLDQSNATFTILAATPLLLSPNGGENIKAGCYTQITWDPARFYTNVRIDYSADGGITWNNLTASYSNGGSYDWLVPHNYGSNYLIKIANITDLLTYDLSNATFSVVNPIQVLTPNGGETLYGCSSYNITWTSGCQSQFRLHYSIDNGTTWNSIANPNYTGGTQSYTWTVPNGINSSQALIRVSDFSNAAVLDVSNTNFTIAPSNDIVVTSPNGGETFQGLSTQMITWTNLPSASGLYNIQYFNGSSWVTAASNVSGNAYNWTVPNVPATTYLVRVIDAVNTCKLDQSNATFTVTPATPIVLTPNGGESIYAATNYNITWNSATYYSTVRIDYSTDNGFSWNTVVASTSNSGSYSWSVPNVASTQCLVKVSNTANLMVNDVSNAVFQIKPAVRIITPNGSDGITEWGGCTVTSITFDHTPAYSTWNIKYSLNGGATWVTVINNWSQTANPATYNWNIPNTSSSQVLVKVEPALNVSYADVSDAPITISKPVIIVQPNFGGIMQVGSTYNISWISDGISNLYDIFFSDNGGSTWSTVVMGYNTSTNTYPWTVPNAASTNCLIRVRDNINSCKEDTSNVPFTISNVAPALTVLSPNGGENLSGCNDQLITWAELSPHGTYDLHYSTNSGSTWIPIELNYATGSMSYQWVVPNINAPSVLIRVKATGTAIEDLSDALLSISPGNLVVTTNDVTVCGGTPVQLNATGASTYSWSPTVGLSDPLIANPVATPTVTTTYIVESVNGTCTLTDSVTITTNSSGVVPVSVAIAASPVSTICTGTSVTFTATPVNEGSTPSYQWMLNGAPAGTNSNTYVNASLSDNDQVQVVLTSNQACVTGNPASSNIIVMDVESSATPSVSVNASATNICTGTNVTFTAIPVNGGSNPAYQWLVNGSNVGANSAIYSSASLNNTDVVTVTMTSNSVCAIGGPVTSTGITMTVGMIPAQPLAISGSASVCEGTGVSYFVAPVAGALSYDWILPAGWSGTSTTNSINCIATSSGGFVTVSASNTCGSSPLQTLGITTHSLPVVSANASVASLCAGQPLTLTGTGASSYNWDNSVSNGVVFNPLVTTTYTVTGTDINGCTDNDQITVTVNALPNVMANTTASAVCSGNPITLSGSGATSYVWNNGVTNNVSFVPSATTTYTVTGTDAAGCSNSTGVTVTVNNSPLVQAGNDQTVCQGTAVTLAGSGASSYTWDNGITNNTPFTTMATATYIVTGTDGNGCTDKDTVGVNVNTSPTVTASATAAAICIGTPVTLTGSGATSYSWNNGVINNNAFSPSATQTYTVTGTDGNGCTDTDQITISVNGLPTVVANATSTNLCPGSPVTLTGSGANSYTWSNGVLNGVAITPAATTNYTVTGTDANGCSNTAQVTVNVFSTPSVQAGNDQTVCEGTAVTLAGSGANSYTWDNGITNNTAFTAMNTTTYIVTGTDGNGCTDKDTVIVNVNVAPVVTASSSASAVCIGTPVTLNGNGATSYTWNNGVTNNSAFSPSATQTYTVTGTDGNGCTDTDQITVSVNALPNVAANATDTDLCAGENVILTGSGANNYSWNNGALNGAAFVPSSTTTYTVTGTDANGCSNTSQVTVNVNALPVIETSGTATICEGTSASITASGGLTYSWNNGAGNGTTVNVSPASTTVYTVTGTDINGCTDTDLFAVTVVPAPVISIGGDEAICEGGSVAITASGATTLNWDNGAGSGTSVTVSPVATTVYTVTGTDGACSATAQVTVTVNELPTITTSGTSPVCEGESVSLTAAGGVSYDWDNGAGSGSPVLVTPASSVTYTVTVTDANGCVNTDQIFVEVNPAPTPVITNNAGVLQTGNYTTYQWYVNNSPTPGATSQTWTYTENGDYYVVVTDGNGCTGTAAEITISDASLAEADEHGIVCYPNPATNHLSIQFGDLAGEKTVRLFDLSGKLVLETTTQEMLMTIDLEVATGYYTVVISAEGQQLELSKKLIVQN